MHKVRGLAEADRGQRGEPKRISRLINDPLVHFAVKITHVDFFSFPTIFAVVKDTGGTAAPGEERKGWCHQPVYYAALPRTQSKATGCS